MVLRVYGVRRRRLSRIVSLALVSCTLVLLVTNCVGTMAQDSMGSAGTAQDPPVLKWYDMSASYSPIPGNPSDQHCFDVVHATNIVQCNKTVDGSNRTYLAYDSDEEGNGTNLFYSNSIAGPWVAYSGNPILKSNNGTVRTPSVVYMGGSFQMFLNNMANKDVERWTSSDGITFTYNETILKSPDDVWTNPFVWLNPNDGKWYLFWVDGNNGGNLWMIYARNSSSITGLRSAADTLVLNSTVTGLRHMACPGVMYRDGYYWLLCENLPTEFGAWGICAFVSTSVTSGYVQCPNSPVLTDDESCPQVFIGDDNVSCYLFTNQIAETWYQTERTVDPRYYLYLTLSVTPSQPAYVGGQSVTLDVTVLNELSSYVSSTLTLTITGPGGYGYFDFDRINAPAGFSDYGFTWTVPNVNGTCAVGVSVVPMQLTAYDAAWLVVRRLVS